MVCTRRGADICKYARAQILACLSQPRSATVYSRSTSPGRSRHCRVAPRARPRCAHLRQIGGRHAGRRRAALGAEPARPRLGRQRRDELDHARQRVGGGRRDAYGPAAFGQLLSQQRRELLLYYERLVRVRVRVGVGVRVEVRVGVGVGVEVGVGVGVRVRDTRASFSRCSTSSASLMTLCWCWTICACSSAARASASRARCFQERSAGPAGPASSRPHAAVLQGVGIGASSRPLAPTGAPRTSWLPPFHPLLLARSYLVGGALPCPGQGQGWGQGWGWG